MTQDKVPRRYCQHFPLIAAPMISTPTYVYCPTARDGLMSLRDLINWKNPPRIQIDFEHREARFKYRPPMRDSSSHYPETAIQYTRGHDFLAFSELRKKQKLSQTELASLIGISVKTLQNWEQRRRVPRGPAIRLLQIISTDLNAVRKALAKRKADERAA